MPTNTNYPLKNMIYKAIELTEDEAIALANYFDEVLQERDEYPNPIGTIADKLEAALDREIMWLESDSDDTDGG